MTPARVLRQLTDEEVAGKTRETEAYIALARRSRDTMREVEALTAPEPGRRRIDPDLPGPARTAGATD